MFPGRGNNPTRRVNLSWKMKKTMNQFQTVCVHLVIILLYTNQTTYKICITDPLTSQQLTRNKQRSKCYLCTYWARIQALECQHCCLGRNCWSRWVCWRWHPDCPPGVTEWLPLAETELDGHSAEMKHSPQIPWKTIGKLGNEDANSYTNVSYVPWSFCTLKPSSWAQA